jgi:DNA replication protein DnaC
MLSKETEEKLRQMRLGSWIEMWPKVMSTSQNEKITFEALLIEMIDIEYHRKQETALNRRIKKAKIPELWNIETYPFDRQPKINRRKVMAAYQSFDYMLSKKNMVWVGPTGTGKSGLATSFLMQALEKNYTGIFVSFQKLMHDFYQAAADHSEQKVLKPYISCDCLLIDEIGYSEVESAPVGLFFELMHRRHKKATTLITTNLGFPEWGTFLKNKHLTAALIDRVTENCDVFNLSGCKSLRHSKGTPVVEK